jgi:hypothetical protein
MQHSNDATVVPRTRIVLHSFQGFSPPRIARRIVGHEDEVCRGIYESDRIGRDAVSPKQGHGPEPKFTAVIRERVGTVALSRPKNPGRRVLRKGPSTFERRSGSSRESGNRSVGSGEGSSSSKSRYRSRRW